jgi:hypothetical protein
MLITVTSAGWRLQDAEDDFEQTRALSPKSHLELNWFEDASGDTLTEVWVSLYLTADEPVQKLMMYRMDAQPLEWKLTFDALYNPLRIALDWNRIDEQSREVTLLNRGVPRNLLAEMGAESAA